MSIFTLYISTHVNHVTGNTTIHIFHITGICPWTNMSATLHIYVSPYYYSSLYRDPNSLYISINKTVTFIYYTTENYVPATNMPHKSHINGTCPNYLLCINGGVCQYVCHIGTHQHQPYKHDCCAQKPMWTMALTPTLTTTVVIHPNYISWTGHWPNQQKMLVGMHMNLCSFSGQSCCVDAADLIEAEVKQKQGRTARQGNYHDWLQIWMKVITSTDSFATVYMCSV